MTDLHQTRTIPAADVRVGMEVNEQDEWALVVSRDAGGDWVRLGLVGQGNDYLYEQTERVQVRLPVNRFIVEVTGCNGAQAAQVMAERLGHDEDYGFDYQVDWAVTS